MTLFELVGTLAAVCTTVAFVPQAVLVWQTRNTASISFSMYTVFIIGVALWTAYGFLTWQWSLIIANIVTAILALGIWWVKVSNMRKGEK